MAIGRDGRIKEVRLVDRLLDLPGIEREGDAHLAHRARQAGEHLALEGAEAEKAIHEEMRFAQALALLEVLQDVLEPARGVQAFLAEGLAVKLAEQGQVARL